MLEERNELILESNDYPLMSFVQGKGVIPKSNRYDRSFLVASFIIKLDTFDKK